MGRIIFLLSTCVLYVFVTPILSTCPETKAVANFNLPRAFGLGIWYELARYPNEYQPAGKCSYHKGRRIKGSIIKIRSFHGLNSTDSVDSNVELDSETGEVIFTFPHGQPKRNVYIKSKPLVMEYDKYAIMYSCEYDETKKNNREYAWILMRSKEPTPEIWEAIDDFFIRSNVIDEKKLVWTDKSDGICKLVTRT